MLCGGKTALKQNLIDAECSSQLTAECLNLSENGQTAQILYRLNKQRLVLLDEIHKHQKALDCLDYLIFQIEKD